jgi:type I restriction enzyme S subunit
MTTDVLNNLPLNKPPTDLLKKYEECIASPCFEKIEHNNAQIQTLQKLRDTLLPKLISGEVSVKK